MTAYSRIRRPHTAQPASLTALQVAKAYNYDLSYTGKGRVGGIIELGGGFSQPDLVKYFGGLGLPVPSVTSVPVAGGQNKSDGPNGADGEVLLDIEVMGTIAPGAAIRVYFGPNTDDGFLAAIKQAHADKCDVISISWGGPESSWSASSMDEFDAEFAACQVDRIEVLVAAGDSGADDGTRSPVADFPASSPHVTACGGTRLTVNLDGSRANEVAWDDNDTSSATGGGVSKHFPGRAEPDVAANADPDSGYEVVIDGDDDVIGGTSAVAPLLAGLCLTIREAIGGPFSLVTTVAANPSVCWDITSGDNGAYKAAPGRDDVTGYGVPDGGRLLAALQGTTTTPPPVVTPPPVTPPPVTPPPVQPPATIPGPVLTFFNSLPKGWENKLHESGNEQVAHAVQVLKVDYGQAK